MRVSILDQAPVSAGQSAEEALRESARLAQVGEALGYTRFWMTEHHDLPGLACSAPEVMLAYIGAQTNTIRLGTGAMLLPHYKPYKVAEVHHMLATLFPGRIDVGIGRAPGGSAEATNALSDNFLQNVFRLPDLTAELLQFLDDTYEPANEHASLSASPLPAIAPEPWMLGTSEKSARLAAEHGMAYAFGAFMSDSDGADAIAAYKKAFQPRQADRIGARTAKQPDTLVTINAICAATAEKAEDIALSSLIASLERDEGAGQNGLPSIEAAKQYKLTPEEEEKLAKRKERLTYGDPQTVARQLINIQRKTGADEIMINTHTHSPADRITSYTLIAEELLS
ncbi:LLM class flavin-dependent oxidoreductase [Bacillus piscicola]|uniref:LLM class flavin-dependent oxidoreductase n=1 Tax=Bacillus piscicola TaxID=1632684 RepID=UPI001F0968AD|nr:LLM class flavin-dependent oxidoreductase [Bacillus piscicola]